MSTKKTNAKSGPYWKFEAFCEKRYGKGCRKSVYLVGVFYAEKKCKRVDAIAAKAKQIVDDFAKWCVTNRVTARHSEKPMWQNCIDFIEGGAK